MRIVTPTVCRTSATSAKGPDSTTNWVDELSHLPDEEHLLARETGFLDEHFIETKHPLTPLHLVPASLADDVRDTLELLEFGDLLLGSDL